MEHAEGTDDPRLEAEGEVALARLALDDGELDHAARHAANAIGTDPTLPEAHETLARIAAGARAAGTDPLDLFSVDGPAYVGTAVARAHLLAAAGRYQDAIGLLLLASRHAPEREWAAVPWVDQPQTVTDLDPEALAAELMQLAVTLPDPVEEAARPPLLPYLRLARNAVAAHPRAARLLGAASSVGRRLGGVDEAVDWARRAAALESGLLPCIWLGYAYRAAGRVDDAVAAWATGLDHDPGNCALMTDIAEVLAADGRMDEATSWIERAMAIDPHDRSAYPTAAALRFARDGRIAHLVGLADHLRDSPDHQHAAQMLTNACTDQPWLGWVPGPGEAATNVLRQMQAGRDTPAEGTLRLSDLEPPSAMATVARLAPGLRVDVDAVREPDIRRPRRPDGRVLWAYEGTVARPALPPPSPAALAALTDVATTGWPHPPAAYDRAVQLAGTPLADLLGLLVHPPAAPDPRMDRLEPGLWPRTVQVWACLGLLHHRADEPWPTSTRRRELIALAFGIEDWVAEAATFALVVAAWVDPRARADAAGQVLARFVDALQVRTERPMTAEWSFARLLLAAPDLPDDVYATARDLLASGESS